MNIYKSEIMDGRIAVSEAMNLRPSSFVAEMLQLQGIARDPCL